jgi:Raf kinase inhibitor-like YbhB/YbcL family protein
MTGLLAALTFFVSLVAAAQTHLPPKASVSTAGLALSTPAFRDGGIIPSKYTRAAVGNAVSPKLTWTNVPGGTVTFALLVRDPDSSVSRSLDEILHWMIFNIPARKRELPEGVAGLAYLNDGSVQALNHNHKVGYMGMAASAAGPYHHYTFELFALDTKLRLGPNATEADLLRQMDGHILMKGLLVGLFHLP